MKVACLSIQGFNLFCEDAWIFHPKEITITNGVQTNHYLLKPALEYKKLSILNKKQVRFEEDNVHGLQYSKGHVNFNEINNILMELLPEYDTVYVKGIQTYKYLKTVCESLLPNLKIINIEELNLWDYPVFKNQKPMCMNHFKWGRCSTTNANILHKWLQGFQP